ncbi:latexin isoform X1 [Bombina bombina]|uniref:latexin isoform X1 n=1 Tax=Bombina bombina TaxID=8345 RepID=UPI00235AB1E3|nr:latexin isoform X1 [Bombina bombina]
MEVLNPSYYPARRAAAVAEEYINYKMGRPHRLFGMQDVTSASRESIEGVGNKYHIKLSIKDILNNGETVNCTAEILYHLQGQNTAPNVSFTLQKELKNDTEGRDKTFYERLRKLEEPLVAQEIPDKFGNVAPEMEPVHHLALVAAAYVKWQNSTENTFFRMAVIKSVKQVKREDAFLEFHLVMLIHEMVTQEMIPWEINILWNPTEGLKIVKDVQLPKCHG